MPLFQIVYASHATTTFAEHELEAFLMQFRNNNEQIGITGVLLFAEGEFIQALEGEATDIYC